MPKKIKVNRGTFYTQSWSYSLGCSARGGAGLRRPEPQGTSRPPSHGLVGSPSHRSPRTFSPSTTSNSTVSPSPTLRRNFLGLFLLIAVWLGKGQEKGEDSQPGVSRAPAGSTTQFHSFQNFIEYLWAGAGGWSKEKAVKV